MGAHPALDAPLLGWGQVFRTPLPFPRSHSHAAGSASRAEACGWHARASGLDGRGAQPQRCHFVPV